MEGNESDDDDDDDDDDKGVSIPSFGPEEFDLLRRWSGATVATRKRKTKPEQDADAEEDEHTNNLDENNNDAADTAISPVVRKLGLSCSIQGLGRACQRLIDYGRSEYIQQNILKFFGALQRYLLTCQANSAFLGRFFALCNSEGHRGI